MPPYRILIVDDSAFMRKVVSDIVAADDAFVVIGTANNGVEAIETITRLKPDAVTLDLEMPVMTGLEALPVIMRDAPTPIVMMSSSTQEGATATIRALELGAFDFVAKPSGPQSMDLDRMRESLLATLHAAVSDAGGQVVERLQPSPVPSPPPVEPAEPALRPSKPAVDPPPAGAKPKAKPEPDRTAVREAEREAKPRALSKPALPPKPSAAVPKPGAEAAPLGKAPKEKAPKERAPLGKAPPKRTAATEAPPPKAPAARRASRPPTNRLVAIGTSTGGPRALQQVLTRLPADFPAPLLIVQHMPAGFTKSLAQRLNTLCAIEVTEAEEGMEVVPGTAYIAPGGLHMTLRKDRSAYRIRLTTDPPVSGHRPSVDALFASIADFPELDRTVVIMTGMGSDGAKGMKHLYDQGVRRTIAEDATSCIVYGMPRAAVELGCVVHEIPLDQIARQIQKEVIQAEEV